MSKEADKLRKLNERSARAGAKRLKERLLRRRGMDAAQLVFDLYGEGHISAEQALKLVVKQYSALATLYTDLEKRILELQKRDGIIYVKCGSCK
jgi:hypothetical protein